MVSSVTSPDYNDSKRLNIFYFSDYHGTVPSYRHLKTASDEFDKKHKDTENFKLSGGDLTGDTNERQRALVYRLLKTMNLDASAVGNHEWHVNLDFYKEASNFFKKAPNILFNKYVACNIEAPDNEKYKEQGLFQSKIITKNNEKYGIIGITTNDDKFDFCKIHNIELDKKDIAREIENLKKKDPSLNKIILLSHMGKAADQEIAKSVSDIDIIISGHSHHTVKGVTPGENLVSSPKNEPVLIVQAGNEQNFGELSIVFDKEGRIDLSKGNEPINIVKPIFDYKEDNDIKELENTILGPTNPVGTLSKSIIPTDILTILKEENPLGNLTADALRSKTDADIGLLNAGTFRAFLKDGKITERDLDYCMPLPNPVVTVKCTGKEIADIIKLGAESLNFKKIVPGICQVSGLKYTVTSDKKIKDLYTVDKNGKKDIEIIDSKGNLVPEKDPNNPKIFKVATIDYFIFSLGQSGLLKNAIKKVNGKTEIDENRLIKKYGFHRDVLKDYLKTEFTNKNRPIEPEMGRITFEKSDKPVDNSFLSLINRYTKKN